MKITLVTFGDAKYQKAFDRLNNQISKLDFIDNVFIVNEEVLRSNTDFYEKHSEYVESHPYGYGSMIWKPYAVELAFKKFNDSDFFIWMDAGNEFNITDQTKQRFFDYLDMADKEDVFAFLGRDGERNLSHCSVINWIYPEAADSLQVESNFMIFKNNQRSLNLVEEWKKYCVLDNYFGVDPQNTYNCCGYWGGIHLHDQSVFSCLFKKMGFKAILGEGSWYLPNGVIGDSMNYNRERFPIFIARNPFEFSVVDKDCVVYWSFTHCKHGDDCLDRLYVKRDMLPLERK